MIYPETYRERGILSRFHHSSHSLIARLAGGVLTVLLLLAGGVVTHDAQGQNQGVPAEPLGDNFVFFVDSINPDLLRVEGITVVNDPEGGDNRVARLANGNFSYQRFFFAEGHDQGVPRDMTANRDAGNVLHFRMLVDSGNPNHGSSGDIEVRYRLSVQFEDYGPDDNAGADVIYNYPFRLRWSIPDSMRNGEWHTVSLQLPPATWADLETAKTTANTITPLEKRWIYGGSWAGFHIGTDLRGPNTTREPTLWKEFEWDNVESVGIQWDWGDAGATGAPIYLDDVYIGPADLDLTGLLPPEEAAPAVSGVNFSVDGNWHVISWTHNAAATDIAQYKVYSSHNPITDVTAQGVALISTITGDLTANGGVHTVRAQGDLPHASVGNAIYYAVTTADASGLEKKDISNSSAMLAATSYSPVVVQLTEGQAATIKANIAAENVVGSGFPSGTVPFTVNQAHSVRTVGGDSPADSDISGSFLVGYSDANEIFIYAEVTDDQVEISPADRNQGDTWQDDTIELNWGNYDVREAGGAIMVSSPHNDGNKDSDDRKRGDYPDYQVRISAHGTAASAVVRSISDLPGGSGAKLNSGSGVYAPMDGGYKILIVLPVAEFKDPIDRENAFPGANEIRYSPMTLTINDRDGGNRGHQITWSLRALEAGDSAWKNPGEWQTVAMVGRNYVADAPQAEPEGIPPAQTKILRVDGGPLTVDLDAAFAKNDADWTVHHYVVDGGATVNTPDSLFVVPSLGWVQLEAGMLTINPTGPGAFKIAVQPGTDAPLPLKVEIMSDDAPMVQGVSSGAHYNAQSNGYVETLNLALGRETSKKLELFGKFHDPNDITLSYNHSDEHVDLRPVVTNPDVVTATLSGSILTIALTDQARGGDASDIWIYAVDSDNEYARLRIGVNVSSATGPYVANALDDVLIREDATTDAKVYLFGAFGDGDGEALTYEVIVHDDSKVEIGENPKVIITSYMRTDIDLRNVGPNSTGEITIRPLKTGSVTFTVKASAGGESVEDDFRLTIVSRNAPKIKTQIPDQVIDADGGPVRIDLTDVDPTTEGEQPAFEDPDGGALTYAATSKNASVVRAGARGFVLTLTPIWGSGGHTYVTVSATDAKGETFPQTFKVTVKEATKPIINPGAKSILAAGIVLSTSEEAKIWNLMNLGDADKKEDYVPLFIDPNARSSDQLPGGLFLEMPLDRVEADHRYDNLSTDNDVYTSAMRITLDPSKATLTVIPIAANSAKVTIIATDRELTGIPATVMITVVSCDGVDMSAPCEGVITGIEGEELPKEVELSQNYPNPFNPQTTIDYALPQASDVSLIVYDMLGREVDVLLDGPQAAGRHTVRFGANHLPNGAYVYRLVAADKAITRIMVLLK